MRLNNVVAAIGESGDPSAYADDTCPVVTIFQSNFGARSGSSHLSFLHVDVNKAKSLYR